MVLLLLATPGLPATIVVIVTASSTSSPASSSPLPLPVVEKHFAQIIRLQLLIIRNIIGSVTVPILLLQFTVSIVAVAAVAVAAVAAAVAV